MRTLIVGIAFITAAIGFVGCGDKQKSNSPETEKKETQSDASKEKMSASLKEAEVHIANIMDLLKKSKAMNAEALAKLIEAKLSEIIAPMKDAAVPENIENLKANLAALLSKVDTLNKDKLDNNEKINSLLKQLQDLEKAMNIKQTSFQRACIASLNVMDADEELKRKVFNAIAFVNTSKVARATETTKNDFDKGSSIKYGTKLPGVVFSGTRSEFRKVDKTYTYYAYSRLPSSSNFGPLRYHAFSTDGANNITGTNAGLIKDFIFSDQDHSYRTEDLFGILNEQSPLRAIDANKIESYTHEDCDRIATYMANVGSNALTTSIDNPIYLSSVDPAGGHTYANEMRAKWNGLELVSDVFSWLDFRVQEAQKSPNPRKGYSDSPRVMVIQDELLRPTVNGTIDYSFLDLVDVPHLRFLAAVDSKIGNAKAENGVDFDNAYQGKNDSLIRFVVKHRKDLDHSRREKDYKDLEAVFINIIPDVVHNAPPEVKKKAQNLFHTP